MSPFYIVVNKKIKIKNFLKLFLFFKNFFKNIFFTNRRTIYMYVIHEKFTDYDNNEREEDFYFNFTEAELTHMQFEKIGGLAAMLQKIIATKDVPKLMNLYEQILQKSYGEKTPDGRGFHKSKELTQSFMETEAYSQIYMRLATDTKAAQDFINHVIPKKMQEQAKLAEQQAHPIPMNK